MGGLPFHSRSAGRGAARAPHSLPRRRLRWTERDARGDGLPRRRGAARKRPSGRHSLPDADDRFPAVRLYRRTGEGRDERAGGAVMRPPERSPERDAAIDALLPNVPFDGWTYKALRMGLRAAGMAEEDAELLFPGGAPDMIEAYSDLSDRRMEEG